VEKPVPREGEVLIRVQAASLNAHDWHLPSADIFLARLMAGGLRKPKRTLLGADVAGTVESIGPSVEDWRPGDRAFGDASHRGDGGLQHR
jgi:NADPH:quinone reductase-like Zn-dependent oxidoreductase